MASTKRPDPKRADGRDGTVRRTDPSRRGVKQVNVGGQSGQGAGRAGGKPGAAGGQSAKARSRQIGTTVRPPKRRGSPALWGWAGGSVVVVAVLVITLVAITNKPVNTSKVSTVPTSIVNMVTNVPPAILDQVGVDNNDVSSTPAENPVNLIKKATSGNGLAPVDGKPVVFYFGALYCPYCATERWAVIVALSRFGTFSGLQGATSSSTDVYPSTATWSFHGSSYSSQYIVFKPVEFENEDQGPLDPLTAAEQNVLKVWDPIESFPFLTIGQKYVATLPGWMDPQLLQTLTRQQIAETLSEPTNLLGNAIDANANYLTAAVCSVDGQAPSDVCTSPGVKAALTQMKKLPAAQPISNS
jgi:thiol-disulfide isomerase/thioredoxin